MQSRDRDRPVGPRRYRFTWATRRLARPRAIPPVVEGSSEKVSAVSCDLPIPLGVLIATEYIPTLGAEDLFLGELSLTVTPRHNYSILPTIYLARTERLRHGARVDFRTRLIALPTFAFPSLTPAPLFPDC